MVVSVSLCASLFAVVQLINLHILAAFRGATFSAIAFICEDAV